MSSVIDQKSPAVTCMRTRIGLPQICTQVYSILFLTAFNRLLTSKLVVLLLRASSEPKLGPEEHTQFLISKLTSMLCHIFHSIIPVTLINSLFIQRSTTASSLTPRVPAFVKYPIILPSPTQYLILLVDVQKPSLA